jgi:hypothetical protein
VCGLFLSRRLVGVAQRALFRRVSLRSSFALRRFALYVVGHPDVHNDVLALYFGTWNGSNPFAAKSSCTAGDMGLVLAILAAVKKLRSLRMDAYWSPHMEFLLQTVNGLEHLRNFSTVATPGLELENGLERLSWQHLQRMDRLASQLLSLRLSKIGGPFKVCKWPTLVHLKLYRLPELRDVELKSLLQSIDALALLLIQRCPRLTHLSLASISIHTKSLEEITLSFLENTDFLADAVPHPERYFAHFGKLETVSLRGTIAYGPLLQSLPPSVEKLCLSHTCLASLGSHWPCTTCTLFGSTSSATEAPQSILRLCWKT